MDLAGAECVVLLMTLGGPTGPRRTGPYRRIDDVVRLKLDCAPCYLRRLSQCPFDHRCMKELGVDTVVGAVEQALAKARAEKCRLSKES